MNVSRDTGLKNLSVSTTSVLCRLRTTELWRNSQIQRVRNLLSKDHDLFIKEVHEFITAEVNICDSFQNTFGIVLILLN